MNFRLDIYTWPAMQGVNPQIRTSYHYTPEGAAEHLERETDPYAHAVLSRSRETGWEPCDWQGQSVTGRDWPVVEGSNGKHPDVVALEADWENLIEQIRRRYDGTRSMLDIASDLLVARHPNVHGWTNKLAWDAAG